MEISCNVKTGKAPSEFRNSGGWMAEHEGDRERWVSEDCEFYRLFSRTWWREGGQVDSS